MPLGTQHLLHCVTRNRVEEEQDQDGDCEDNENFKNGPLVIVPDDVADRF